MLTLNSSVSTKERINEICLQPGAGGQCSDSPLSVCQFNSSTIGEKENLSALAIYGNKVPIALIKANKKTGGRVLFQRTKETQVTISHFFRKESDEIGEDELRKIKNLFTTLRLLTLRSSGMLILIQIKNTRYL
ncbi:MAG: hypothetical protein L6Q37_14555 [Bdellovibrionaceae bacterium]|nr:hypothetical protein [Pseudobdellovibrionaceae bacterium]NUM60406.1 hypothetical protein [Pseudobdellovibrionaceae bacterium]